MTEQFKNREIPLSGIAGSTQIEVGISSWLEGREQRGVGRPDEVEINAVRRLTNEVLLPITKIVHLVDIDLRTVEIDLKAGGPKMKELLNEILGGMEPNRRRVVGNIAAGIIKRIGRRFIHPAGVSNREALKAMSIGEPQDSLRGTDPIHFESDLGGLGYHPADQV